MAWLCGGVLAGGFLQMAVPAAVLLREGWRPRPDFALSPCIREIARLMTPGFLGTAIYQINIYVAGMLAVNVSESANTLLFYANRLMELPIGVFAIAELLLQATQLNVVATMLKLDAVRLPSMADFRKCAKSIILSSGLGTFAGTLTHALDGKKNAAKDATQLYTASA